MAGRDRLIEMQKLAGLEEGRANQREGPANRLAARQEKESFERFLADVDEIRHVLMTLSMDREAIRREQLESLASGASDSSKSRQLKDHVDRFIAQARVIRDRLGRANRDLANYPDSGFGTGRARHEQVGVLTLSFETIMNKFNEEHIEYKDRAARKIAEYLRKQNIQVSDDQINEAIESGSLFQLTRNVHLGVQQKKALFDDVKSRATDIMLIEQQILEISELFEDMHAMVSQQGETIERIETSVMNAEEYAAKAERNVKEAVVLRRRGNKCKIVFVIVAILLVLLALMLFKIFVPFI